MEGKRPRGRPTLRLAEDTWKPGRSVKNRPLPGRNGKFSGKTRYPAQGDDGKVHISYSSTSTTNPCGRSMERMQQYLP